MMSHPTTNADPAVRSGGRPRRIDSLKVAFFMPLLLGPPGVILGGFLGIPWLGLIVAFAGTSIVARDNIHARSERLRTGAALATAMVFVFCWTFIACAVVTGLIMLFPDAIGD
jgi:hypothetical protein